MNPLSATLVLLNSRRAHKMKPCDKKDAAAEKHTVKSSYFYTPSIRDDWYCGKTGTQSKERDVCCIVAIRLG